MNYTMDQAKTLHLILKETTMLLHSASEDNLMQSFFLLLSAEDQVELRNCLLELNIECGRLFIKLGSNPRLTAPHSRHP
jgi:hypothetical protein